MILHRQIFQGNFSRWSLEMLDKCNYPLSFFSSNNSSLPCNKNFVVTMKLAKRTANYSKCPQRNYTPSRASASGLSSFKILELI